MLQTYVEEKVALASYTKSLLDLAKKHDLRIVSQDLESLEKRMADDHFQLVVVGMFSRGKSTFVDALLGKRLLPTSKKPTTAVISKITYGEKPAFFLHYKDESASQELSEESFFNLTASNTEGDDGAEEEVDRISYAEVRYPLTFCQHGVELVDTPGTNDLNQARVEITYQYLNKADAVIMLLAADQALSIGEVEFLKERIIKNQISDIFFIINRKDTLSGPEEEARVLEFVKDNLTQIVGVDFTEKLHIHLVSSYQALLSRRHANGESLSVKQQMKIPESIEITGFPAFEEDLAQFLELEKGKVKLRRFSGLLIKQALVLDTFLQDRHHIIFHSTDDLDTSIDELQASIKRTKKLVSSVIKEVRLDFDQSKVLVLDKCKLASAKVRTQLKADIGLYSGDYNNKELKSFINQHLETARRHIIDEVSAYQEVVVKKTCQQAEKKIEKFFSILNKQYKEAFNLSSNRPILHLDDAQELVLEDKGSFEEVVSRNLYQALKSYALDPNHNILLRGIADLILNFTSNSVEDQIRRMVDRAYPSWAENVENHIVKQYETYVNQVVDRVGQIATNQLDELTHQLELVRQEQKIQVAERDNALSVLDEEIKMIADLVRTLKTLR